MLRNVFLNSQYFSNISLNFKNKLSLSLKIKPLHELMLHFMSYHRPDHDSASPQTLKSTKIAAILIAVSCTTYTQRNAIRLAADGNDI